MTDATDSGDPGQELTEFQLKIIRLCYRNMNSWLQQRVSPEEMAQSIFASVIRMDRQGKVDLEQAIRNGEDADFWRYIVAVALNKIRKKSHYEGKRTRVNEPLVADGSAQAPGDHDEEAGLSLVECLAELERRLDQQHRKVLECLMNGWKNTDIALEIGATTRTVGRYKLNIKDTAQLIWGETRE